MTHEHLLHLAGYLIVGYLVWCFMKAAERWLNKIGSYNYVEYNARRAELEREARKNYEAYRAKASAADNRSDTKETGL